MNTILPLFLFFALPAFSQNTTNLLLQSKILNRKIDVTSIDYSQGKIAPLFYFTDGKKMLNNKTAEVLAELSKEGILPQAKFIFVASIDPDTQEDYRNEYFFCNENYVRFFEEELIPTVEKETENDQLRCLVGVSFGGLNAAFFAAETNLFQAYGLLSPITYPCEDLNRKLVFSPYQNYKVYISTGQNDAENYVAQLLPMLKSKTDKIKSVKTEGGHDFVNWNGQLQDLIRFMTE